MRNKNIKIYSPREQFIRAILSMDLVRIIKLIKEGIGDLNFKDNFYRHEYYYKECEDTHILDTPLTFIVRQYHKIHLNSNLPDIIQLLINNGANPQINNSLGKDALYYAYKQEDKSLLEILQSHLKK